MFTLVTVAYVFNLTVDEVKKTMNKTQDSLSSCVHLVHQLNSLLPRDERLEKFKLHPDMEEDSDIEEDTDGACTCVCT